MPLYESTLIARPDISSHQVEGLSEQFMQIVRDKGGEVAKTEYWGLRSLTYKIKKNRKGHYLHMQIDAPAEAIAELERNMRINEDVMRFLTIRVDALDPEPSAMMQSKGSRESRGRGEYRSRDGARGDGPRGAPRDAAADGKPAAESAKPAATAAAASDDGPEPKAETKSEAKSETKAETKSEPKSEPKAETKSETKSEPKAETKSETKSETEADSGAEK